MDQVTVEFHRGIPPPPPSQIKDGDQWIRHATIRGLTGLDEKAISDISPTAPLHFKVVKFLARITTFENDEKEGNNNNNPESLIRKLSLGDRVSLLLCVKKLMSGDTISSTVQCPHCRKSMSADLSVDNLLKVEQPKPELYYELNACGFKMLLRPLTAEDQDNIILANNNNNNNNNSSNEALTQALAKICIINSEPALPKVLSEDLLEAIGSKLEQIDPLSDITLNLSCPECSLPFQAEFNVEDFVLREIVGINRYQQVEREVHWLAWHYHWSENEILSLPVSRRKRYVELVNATLAGESI